MPKPLSVLSPTYRKRLQNYARKHGVSISEARTAARGHAKTPEHPERAVRQPVKYQEYTQRLSDLQHAVQQKKLRVFPYPGSKKTLNRSRSASHVLKNPNKPSGAVNRSYMTRFLRMSDSEILDIDWSDEEWGFLFYH